MISFKNDYSEFAHENILKRMLDDHNQYVGYGLDDISNHAKKLIKEHISKDVDIHFLVGGTQTNKTIIDHILRPYQAVIACDGGHINVHETGAIEATGHKVLIAKSQNGKITTDGIKEVFYSHPDEHMVMPKMVYISNSTEIGTIYTKAELESISLLCKRLGLYLFLDGARLAVALTASSNDLTIDDLANFCDVFYIGGTKNGALLGEAVVISNDKIKDNFRYSIKRNGGLLAKGFVAGVQFDELFKNDLYFRLGLHANEMALKLKEGLLALGFKLAFDSNTNQQFVIVNQGVLDYISKKYLYEVWDQKGNDITVRLVTSWATKEKDVLEFLKDLKDYLE